MTVTRYPGGVSAAVASAPGLSGLTQGRFVGVTALGAPSSGTFAVGDYVLDQNGMLFCCCAAGAPGIWITPRDLSSQLTVGQETFSRELILNSGIAPTQVVKFTYFTSRKSEVTTQVRVTTGGIAAAATPTLCRLGLYSIAANGDGTLVASTTNDTTLFAANFTTYTKSWTSPYTMIAGQRYAAAHLVVSSAATPTWSGQLLIANPGPRTEYATDPRLGAVIGSQSDLPSTFTAATANSGIDGRTYFAILP
jgi:hypothetical protein